jgi:hypothetical protein
VIMDKVEKKDTTRLGGGSLFILFKLHDVEANNGRESTNAKARVLAAVPAANLNMKVKNATVRIIKWDLI